MKTITTTYIGPTNTKGARIKVTDGDLTLYAYYDPASSNPHRTAMLEFCKKHNWSGTFQQAHLQKGYAFIFLSKADTFTVKTVKTVKTV